jgi:hypothetical protein
MQGIQVIHDLTGSYPVYPAHPLTTAVEIISVFEHPRDALDIDRTNGLNCPLAVSDARISGDGGGVHNACELLRRAMRGDPSYSDPQSFMDNAAKTWVYARQSDFPHRLQEGCDQADKLRDLFPELLKKWLAVYRACPVRQGDVVRVKPEVLSSLMSGLKTKLTDREGVVDKTWVYLGGDVTKVRGWGVTVRWGKRAGRGKEFDEKHLATDLEILRQRDALQ